MKGLLNTITILFRKERKFYFKLVRLLGYLPADISHYRTAFIHKSVHLQNGKRGPLNNERLEYLGDAILGAIVAEFLFRKYPARDEGFLTKLRARIVKRKNLNYIAVKMGIPDLILSRTNPVNISKHLYGNALEALIGAIYLDKGYHRARKFFAGKIIQKHIDLLKLAKKDTDYKSRIIEWAQKTKNEIIFESVSDPADNDLNPSFVASVKLNDIQLGTGRGGSKKEAEQHAAREALTGLKKYKDR